MAQVITDRLLEDYLKCHSKAYLRVHDIAVEAPEYLAVCSHLDARHRAGASQRLSQTCTDGVCHFGGSLFQDMATTDGIILDAVGVADGLKTRFHALQRTPGGSRLGAYHYQPIRFTANYNPMLQSITFWRSMRLSWATCRASHQKLAFYFAVLRFAE